MFLVALLAGIPAVLVALATFIKTILDAKAAREDARALREEAKLQAVKLADNTKLTEKVDRQTDGNFSEVKEELKTANAQIAALFKFIAEAQIIPRHNSIDEVVRKEISG